MILPPPGFQQPMLSRERVDVSFPSEQGRLYKWQLEYDERGEHVATHLADPDMWWGGKPLFDLGIKYWEINADFGRGWPLVARCGCRYDYLDDTDRIVWSNSYNCRRRHGGMFSD